MTKLFNVAFPSLQTSTLNSISSLKKLGDGVNGLTDLLRLMSKTSRLDTTICSSSVSLSVLPSVKGSSSSSKISVISTTLTNDMPGVNIDISKVICVVNDSPGSRSTTAAKTAVPAGISSTQSGSLSVKNVLGYMSVI